jgi:hypothetical protein
MAICYMLSFGSRGQVGELGLVCMSGLYDLGSGTGISMACKGSKGLTMFIAELGTRPEYRSEIGRESGRSAKRSQDLVRRSS